MSNLYFFIKEHALRYQCLRHQESTVTDYANSVDPDEVAQNEPPHLYLHCLPSSGL